MTNKVPTLRDIADHLGVSTATVSLVLNNYRGGNVRISAATRQRVIDAARELGYVPNQTARDLRRRATMRIAVVLPSITAPSFDALAESIEYTVTEHGYTTIISVARDPEAAHDVLRQVRGGLADAALLRANYLDEPEMAAACGEIAAVGVPIVVFSNHITPQHCDIIRTTEYETSYAALTRLIEDGHRRIGILNHYPFGVARRDRQMAYRDALADNDLPLDMTLVRQIEGGWQARAQGYSAARELLRLPDPPSVLFCTADAAALSAVVAARDAGLRVPQDVSVLGVSNIPEAAAAQPALSSIGPENSDYTPVAQLLLDRLLGRYEGPGREYVQQWHLFERETTCPGRAYRV